MDSLREKIRNFVKEREWEKFHSPKNLAMGLSVEAAELLEIFLWLKEEESWELDEKKMADLRQEIGDIVIYIFNIADKFNLDPIDCAKQKLELNREKYPPHLVRGSAKKYTEYR